MVEEERANLDRAITAGVSAGTRSLQLRARGEINARFKGSAFTRSGSRRVANAIRSRVYDNGPLRAAGIVYSKFGKGGRGDFDDFLAPFVFGATIRPIKSKWLYISLEKSRRLRRSVRVSPAFRKNVAFVNIGGG
ncbi:MAG TPA: hypothetical protein EYP07_13275, partial [Kiloniellaceae bacterium]|nr:hypothetical protein [Kiloniellaceae bacterium]